MTIIGIPCCPACCVHHVEDACCGNPGTRGCLCVCERSAPVATLSPRIIAWNNPTITVFAVLTMTNPPTCQPAATVAAPKHTLSPRAERRYNRMVKGWQEHPDL